MIKIFCIAVILMFIYDHLMVRKFKSKPRTIRCLNFMMYYHEIISDYADVLHNFDERMKVGGIFALWAQKISYSEIVNNKRPLKLSEYLSPEDLDKLEKQLPFTDLNKEF